MEPLELNVEFADETVSVTLYNEEAEVVRMLIASFSEEIVRLKNLLQLEGVEDERDPFLP